MKDSSMKTLRRVLRYVQKRWLMLTASIVLAAASVAGTLYVPILVGDAIDCITGPVEHYEEKMNFSFEPASPAPEQPQRPLEQAKQEIRRSGRHTGLKIAALVAAVAIVAAVGGSALTKAIDAIGQKNLEKVRFFC